MPYAKYLQRDAKQLMKWTPEALKGVHIRDCKGYNKIGYCASIYGCKYEIWNIIHDDKPITVVTDPYGQNILTR